MYEVPSRGDVAKVIVTAEVALGEAAPTLIPVGEAKKKKSA